MFDHFTFKNTVFGTFSFILIFYFMLPYLHSLFIMYIIPMKTPQKNILTLILSCRKIGDIY